MDDFNDIEDTGSTGDLDATDQLPVFSDGEDTLPLCYICEESCDSFDATGLTTGVYPADSVVTDKQLWAKTAWNRHYRLILFHSRKRICRLSGISCMNDNDIDFHTRQAPWDKTTVIVRPESGSSRRQDLLATALQFEAKVQGTKDRLMCLLVHARCWQLLCTHRAWSLSEGDIKVLMRALLRKGPLSRDPRLYSVYGLNVGCSSLPCTFDDGDPFRCKRVEVIIRRARQRAGRRFKSTQKHQEPIHLNLLPLEVLLLIAGFLSPADAAVVQKAVGLYLGDSYWRSKVPEIFHEVREISSETLDWGFLCCELNQLEAAEDDDLDSRRYVIGKLD
ncbi:hypothetical protein P170DRAFT_506502, partial [Aspergillus steynii IBT 23096]